MRKLNVEENVEKNLNSICATEPTIVNQNQSAEKFAYSNVQSSESFYTPIDSSTVKKPLYGSSNYKVLDANSTHDHKTLTFSKLFNVQEAKEL